MVSRAPVLHTYALTSLNYWKWDHPQLWCEPLPRREGLHRGIAPATKTSSGRPCPSLWCPLPGRQTRVYLDKPSVAWFHSVLPAARGLGGRHASVSVFLEQVPRCGSAQTDPSKPFVWTCMMLPVSHFALTCQFVPIPQVKSQFQSEALILFSVLGLRLRTGNSTLPLKAFFHLPCKAQQSPSVPHSVLHIRGSVSKCIMVRFQPAQTQW